MDVLGAPEGLTRLCGSHVKEDFSWRELKPLHVKITVASPIGQAIRAPSVSQLVSVAILKL